MLSRLKHVGAEVAIRVGGAAWLAGSLVLCTPQSASGGSGPLVAPTIVYVGHGVALVAAETPLGCDVLFRSHDLAHWTDLSGRLPGSVRCDFWGSASFIDQANGWLLGRSGRDTETVLLRTRDAGRFWRLLPGSTTGSNGGFEDIGFTNAVDGWRQQVAIGSSGPFLLERTETGGASWSEVPTGSATGCDYLPYVFASKELGYAGDPFSSEPNGTGGFWFGYLWRTEDGGRDWQPMALPRPQRVPAAATALVGEPTFSGSVGTVPVVYLVPGREDVVLFRTHDYGRRWGPIDLVEIPGQVRAGGEGLCPGSDVVTVGRLVDVRASSQATWWVLRPPAEPSQRTDVFRIVSRHGHFETLGTVAKDLPVFADGGDAISMWPLDARAAVVTLEGGYRGYTTIYRTTDGGRSWVRFDLSD